MSFQVLNPGLMTTIQDRGRPGYYNVGIPPGGCLDQYSAEIANALVGNTQGEAMLECTYMAPTLIAQKPAVIAVTGAQALVTRNGEPVPQWSQIALNAGDEVSFGYFASGARLYIAFRGGIDVPEVLGSRSTYLPGAFGGFHGRKLHAGDEFSLANPRAELPPLGELDPRFWVTGSENREVRVILGLYDHLLTEQGVANLTQEPWELTHRADRAGLRFSGPGVSWRKRTPPFGAGSDPSNIVDAGYPVGCIQIPGGTQPIVLHRDAVSGGGYATVATVISADLDTLARATPGDIIRFRAVSLEEALEARQHNAHALTKALESLQART